HKNRHPERSASQIYRGTPRSVARSRRTPRMLILPMPFGAFQPPKPALGGPATVFPWGREQGLLASCHVRRLHLSILGSHTGTLYIGVTSNLYLRVMQHKEGTLEGFTAAYGCNRLLYFEGYEGIRAAIAREKQLKDLRREKKLNLIRTINPEFKDLAQTWGWKMITVHEKMHP
ncbi:MAG TPA: GIY-YIG nuclease family protein, partial [Acidobacteriaceae bacterium]|nr:GIY-YIG nuclease family protein [Acidobacteriaceae bacterium]